MDLGNRSRKRIGLVGAAVLLTGACAFTVVPRSTDASVGIKHSGPLMTLNNGRTVQILTSVSDTQTNVKEIDYTVHGPVGTVITKVSYAKAWAGLINRAVYVHDQPAGTYTTDTLVRTAGVSATAVSAQTLVQYGTTKHTVSATGLENAHISAKLTG